MYTFDYVDGLSKIFIDYEKYVKVQESKGQIPSSLLKFALGNF